MTTVILVTIGILLAAASALMVVWYGGAAFDEGRINAEAARLLSEGSQIERAVGNYRSQEGKTPDVRNGADPMEALIERRYLADRPSGDNGRWFVDYSSGMIRADLGATDDVRALAICRAARKSQNLPNPGRVYMCDGSDYPFSHPNGTLPAVEPCCTWSGATGVDVGGGRGSHSGGFAPAPVDGWTDQTGYNPVGSTNSYSTEERVEFLRRAFDAAQEGTKKFYMKYHQISTIEHMIDTGFIPGWVRTAASGDYGPLSVQTDWSQTPWPGGVNANKPYVHVSLKDGMFSQFSQKWTAKYGHLSRPDNYYGNHLSERIYLPLFPTDVSSIMTAFQQFDTAFTSYSTSKGFIPRQPLALVSEGFLSRLPASNYGTFGANYEMMRQGTGEQRAVVMNISNEEACRTLNININSADEIPESPKYARGCFSVGPYPSQLKVYSFVSGDVDQSTWYPYDEMGAGNPSPHFEYTSSQPSLTRPFDGTYIRMNGYSYWYFIRHENRLVLHPGPNPDHMTILRFVAPEAGSYFLRGVAQPIGGCGNGVNMSIEGFTSRWLDGNRSWPFSFHRTLAKGQKISFSVQNNGSDSCDSTFLDLTVSKDP